MESKDDAQEWTEVTILDIRIENICTLTSGRTGDTLTILEIIEDDLLEDRREETGETIFRFLSNKNIFYSTSQSCLFDQNTLELVSIPLRVFISWQEQIRET